MSAQPSSIMTEAVTITAGDGRDLVGTLFLPTSRSSASPGGPGEGGSAGSAVSSSATAGSGAANSADVAGTAVVLHPATGVNQHLYRGFAQYLAGRGWPVLTYDLRGSGLSVVASDKRDKRVRMSDWILKDVPAATAWLKERFPGHRHVGIGHSVGAHGMLATQAEQPVDAMVMIASHAGITATISTRVERAKVWGIFNLITPVTAKALGYVPVERLGVAKQIPVGVMTQWARWSRDPEYFFGDEEFDLPERFAAASGPVLSVVFGDDSWANRAAVDVLTDRLISADVEKVDIECGKGTALGPVGHMGFYRSKNRELWPQVAEWVAERVG